MLLTSGIADCRGTELPPNAAAAFSPNGSRLMWLFDRALWTGTGAGEQPRQVLADAEFRSMSFVDEDRVAALRTFTDGYALIALDLSESAPSPRAVVDQVFFYGPEISPRRAFCVNAYNAQDRNGKLSLVDLEDFSVEDVAESIADYAVGWPPASGAETFPFAYVRTSRFASPRDGLWVGHIPRAHVERP
jgi:hypothetical protein